MATIPALVVVDAGVTAALDPVLLLAAYQEALAEVGVTGVPDGEIIAAFGRDARTALHGFLIDRGRDGSAAAQVVRLLTARIVRDLAERRHPPADAAREGLALLRGAGVPVVLLSELPTPVLDALLLRYGWRGMVSTTLSVDRVRADRPAPDLIREAMARAGVADASRVGNVAGHHRHLRAGRAAGVGCNVAVGWTTRVHGAVLADVVVPDLVTAARRLLGGPPQAEANDQRKRSMTSRSI